MSLKLFIDRVRQDVEDREEFTREFDKKRILEQEKSSRERKTGPFSSLLCPSTNDGRGILQVCS